MDLSLILSTFDLYYYCEKSRQFVLTLTVLGFKGAT